VNGRLQDMLEKWIGRANVEEISFGGLVVAIAEKKR
jgi:hypothetical protein